jgi:hypothetical protein
MLRITGTAGPHGERFELEGRLAGPHVLELQALVVSARRRVSQVCLDLSELTFLDTDGARVVRELSGQGVKIHGCSVFVAELLGLPGPARRAVAGHPEAGQCWP